MTFPSVSLVNCFLMPTASNCLQDSGMTTIHALQVIPGSHACISLIQQPRQS